jgi:hypothetical protein
MISSMLFEEGLDMSTFLEYIGSFISWISLVQWVVESKHVKREVAEVMTLLELVVKAFGRNGIWE